MFPRELTYLSLFSGIGGFEVGLLNVFPKARCLGFCEINPHCVTIYQARFPFHPLLDDGDVSHVDFKKFRGQVDLVMAGFPCQDLSSLNAQRKGLQGTKSSLFYQALRCLKETKCPFFVFENVKSMNPQQRDSISRELGVEPVLLDAAPFTLQTRKRLFWANFPIPPPPALPVLEGKNKLPFALILDSKSKVLPLARSPDFVRYLYQPLGISKNGAVIRRIDRYKIYSDTDEQFARCLPQDHNKCALVDRRFIPPLVRKFSVEECEKLQGFPEKWTHVSGSNDPPRGAKLSALGNAVNAKVSHYVFVCFKHFILDQSDIPLI